MDFTTGDIEFMGEIVGGTIIFGESGTEPILGITALESVGIEVDPRTQKLTTYGFKNIFTRIFLTK